MEPYADALRRGLARWAGVLNSPRLSTVFFGGGTPSYLRTGQLAALMDAVRAGFDYIEGEAVCAPVESSKHVRPFETQDLLAHLLP